MTIDKKVKDIIKNKYYIFCGMQFNVLDTDYIEIYECVDKKHLLYRDSIINYNSTIPADLKDKEYIKEELEKTNEKYIPWHYKFAVCFYLNNEKEKSDFNMGINIR